MPAPVATAPPRSKNSRRSMDTPRRVLTLGQSRRAYAAGNVRTRTGEGTLSQSVVTLDRWSRRALPPFCSAGGLWRTPAGQARWNVLVSIDSALTLLDVACQQPRRQWTVGWMRNPAPRARPGTCGGREHDTAGHPCSAASANHACQVVRTRHAGSATPLPCGDSSMRPPMSRVKASARGRGIRALFAAQHVGGPDADGGLAGQRGDDPRSPAQPAPGWRRLPSPAFTLMPVDDAGRADGPPAMSPAVGLRTRLGGTPSRPQRCAGIGQQPS